MRNHATAACLVASLLAVGYGAGCGTGATSSTVLTCSPACPAGTHCEESGCVLDAPLDLGAPAADLSAAGCQGCVAPTPYCNDRGACVACLEDGQCPVGQLCRALGGATACVVGCSDDSRCGGGSNRCCGGGCVDTATDGANCGACGTACSAAHAAAACAGGACSAGECDRGWGDCNHDVGDGCETNTRVDARNCGGCGATCSVPNGTAGCASACYLAGCDFGWDDCNGKQEDGCEVSVLSDVSNCGACGASCPRLAHAQSTCKDAACRIARCDVGFGDCDGNPANGCETNLNTDANHCGACGGACGNQQICKNGGCTCPQCNFPNARSKCVNLVCTFDGCQDGFGDCNNDLKDGCEQDLISDRTSCGACGNVCPMNMPACLNGVCDRQVVIDTHNLKGYTEYPLDPEICQCCGRVSTKETADALCKLAGYTVSTAYVSEMVVGTNCYCWNCTQPNAWASNCCQGKAQRPLITSVTCQ